MNTTSPLKVQNLTKRIKNATLVDHLSFELDPGKIYGFLGPNGAGKTTTIRMITGLISITEGEVFINGYDIKKSPQKALSHLGVIVENPSAYGYLSGYENLQQSARLSLKSISSTRMKEIIKLVDLEHAIHNKVKTYSLGMRQRLGIAQALLHEPSILILDEPTNGLDPAGIRQLRDNLKQVARDENTTILVSSHLLQEIEMICEEAIVLDKGKLVDVIKIKDDSTEPSKMVSLLIEVSNVGKALDVLSSFQVVQSTENAIELLVEQEQVPNVVYKLAENRVDMYEMKRKAVSLEDHFLTLTAKGSN
ncbi:ABC transporter ATP-binding protein [Priestia koreensis]|uniref:ABC transporter ATP-binding protein n=1 Tax=Priestia koreensis TaxID=284581 RepID=UPI000A7AF63D|nr:ABC transporter ATP-binding protein [Priestia koreensis]MCM3004602.1 ABC transporter ATP-binding protein [Priestia koreensis]